MTSLLAHWGSFALLGVAALLPACSDGGKPAPIPLAGPGEFESANPRGADGNMPPFLSGNLASGSNTPDSSKNPPPGAIQIGAGEGSSYDELGEALVSSHVVELDGTRLYAVSRHGVTIVDTSRTDRLVALGSHRFPATPVDAHARGDVLLVLYRYYEDYSYEDAEDAWTNYFTSVLVAFDVRDPSAVSELARFPIAGDATHADLVGDVLYVASTEAGDCEDCPHEAPLFQVRSFDVTDPTAIRAVDSITRTGVGVAQMRFASTSRRLYVTTSLTDTDGRSTLEVIDVSDPSGDLQEGASMPLTGLVRDPEHIDERDGVLRVVSHVGKGFELPGPVVSTFQIESARTLAPLASQPLSQLGGGLASVRFEGARVYLDTQRGDKKHLAPVNLADPTAPRLGATVDVPGALIRFEPRGDRLLALSYDRDGKGGDFHLFVLRREQSRVNPQARKRASRGKWGEFRNDGYRRVASGFEFFDDLELALVPFSGRPEGDGGSCTHEAYRSGIQVVDLGDDFRLRGLAPTTGAAKEILGVADRLLAVSVERVESLDLRRPDAPAVVASLPIARFVYRTARASDQLLRVIRDWWTDEARIDVTALADASAANPLASVPIPQLTQQSCSVQSWFEAAYANDDTAFVFYSRYARSSDDDATDSRSGRMVSVDLSNPEKPVLGRPRVLNLGENYPCFFFGAVPSGGRTLFEGSTFVMLNRKYDFDYETGADAFRLEAAEVVVLDFENPSVPQIARVELSPSIGATGLIRSGTVVATSQFQPVDSDYAHVRFYLERVDIRDVWRPRHYPRVNIPGSLLDYDAKSENALTVDYRYVGAAVAQTIHLVHIDRDRATILDSLELEPTDSIEMATSTGDRAFLVVNRHDPSSKWPERGPRLHFENDRNRVATFPNAHTRILTLTGLTKGALDLGEIEVPQGNGDSYAILSNGPRALVSMGFNGKYEVIDATDATQPAITGKLEIPGSLWGVDCSADDIVMSFGSDGAMTVPFPE